MNLYESIKGNLKESYKYNWKDDIEDMENNDDIFYGYAENMAEQYPEQYGPEVDDVLSQLINVFKIPKRSRLYKYLLKWYGSEDKLLKEVRNVWDTGDAIYFETGTGYSIFDADLLGGNADGETERKFNKFVDEQESGSTMNESDPNDDPDWHHEIDRDPDSVEVKYKKPEKQTISGDKVTSDDLNGPGVNYEIDIDGNKYYLTCFWSSNEPFPTDDYSEEAAEWESPEDVWGIYYEIYNADGSEDDGGELLTYDLGEWNATELCKDMLGLSGYNTDNATIKHLGNGDYEDVMPFKESVNRKSLGRKLNESEKVSVRMATNINWETDGDKEALRDLPKEVELPDWVSEDEVADYLSDEYDYLVNSVDVKTVSEEFESEGKTVKDYLDYELEDDDTETGGIEFAGEKVRDFIADPDMGIKPEDSIEKLNDALRECGIRPIKESDDTEDLIEKNKATEKTKTHHLKKALGLDSNLNIMSYGEWKNSEDYWGRLNANYGIDSETDLETHGVSKQDIWDAYKEYIVAVANGGKVYTKEDYLDEADGSNNLGNIKAAVEEVADDFSIDFSNDTPFEMFYAPEEDEYMESYDYVDFFNAILSKLGVSNLVDASVSYVSDGKHEITFKGKNGEEIVLDIDAWDDEDNVIDNVEAMLLYLDNIEEKPVNESEVFDANEPNSMEVIRDYIEKSKDHPTWGSILYDTFAEDYPSDPLTKDDIGKTVYDLRIYPKDGSAVAEFEGYEVVEDESGDYENNVKFESINNLIEFPEFNLDMTDDEVREAANKVLGISNINESEDEGMKEFDLEFWVDEEARDQGFSDTLYIDADDVEEAIAEARKYYNRENWASCELLDDNGEVIFGIYPEEDGGEVDYRKENPLRESVKKDLISVMESNNISINGMTAESLK